MLGIIHNEQKVVEEILENKTLIVSMSNTIDILIKYYYLRNRDIDKLELLYTILDNIKACNLETFKASKCEEMITNRIDKFYKTIRKYGEENVKLNIIDKVVITKAEVELINTYDDKKVQNVMFIMLVYAKITNQLNNNESYWLNQSLTNIMKEAKVTDKTRKTDIFHSLYKEGAISTGNRIDRVSIKVNYAYEDSEEAIVITDFDGCIHYWLMYKGEKWKRCKECGKWIKIYGVKDNSKKYCKGCAKVIQQEQKNDYKKREKEKKQKTP